MFSRTAKGMVIPAILIFLLALALPVLANTSSSPTSAGGVVPYISDQAGGGGNVACVDLGYDYSSERSNYDKDNDAFDAPFPEGISVMVTNGTYVEWTSTFPIGAVIVKGSNDANVYEYIPAALGDSGLASPPNASGGPAGLSNLTFCWNLALTVEKSAVTSYDREWDWTIEKSADQTELTLAIGQSFDVNYTVVVAPTSTDSNWAVTGIITVTNPNPAATATVVAVEDVVSPDIAAAVDCGVNVTFPYELPAGNSLVCTYDAALPDGTNRVNTATVTTSGTVPGGEGSAEVIFGDTPSNEIDECIVVSDPLANKTGVVCQSDERKTLKFSYTVGPYDVCGDYTVVNTASFLTKDTRTTGNSSWTVTVNVPCGGGCTLTQGYWKTHSEFGPAPYDDNWANLPNGASTPFFSSGQSYYEVLWTPPAGNPYYTLAHQWIAAYLNVLNGASIPADVESAWNSAQTLFNTYTPAQVAASKTLGKAFKRYVGILDQYNNGYTGPGHCSEQYSETSQPTTNITEKLLPQPVLLPGNQG